MANSADSAGTEAADLSGAEAGAFGGAEKDAGFPSVAKTGVIGNPEKDAGLWQRRYQSLVVLCTSIDWSLDPQKVYQSIARMLTAIFGCDVASIYLATAGKDWFAGYHYPDTSDEEAFASVRLIDSTSGRMPYLTRTHRPIILDSQKTDAGDSTSVPVFEAGYQSVATVPMLAGDVVLGNFNILYKNHQTWDEDDLGYLCSLGRVLGATIKHSFDAQKAAELQVLDESRRLSAEVHDNIAQAISAMKLGIESASMSYEDGDFDAVGRKLARQELIAEQAMATVREEMIALREDLGESDDLVSSIKDILARFNDTWKMDGELEVIGFDAPVTVSSQTALQLMRILHESLANVLQHAETRKVRVLLGGDRWHLTMSVTDDGCGFDVDSVPSKRLGIRIMRERAASIGGQLAVISRVGKGTTVSVDIPRLN